MAASARFEELIRTVYHTSSGLVDVQQIFEKAGEVFNSHIVGCFATNVVDRTTSIPIHTGLSAQDITNYNTYYSDKNVAVERSLSTLLEGRVASSADLFSDAWFRRTEYYSDYLRPLDAHYLAGFLLTPATAENCLYAFSLCRPFTQGAFTRDELRKLATLKFHAESAWDVHTNLRIMRQNLRASSEALEHLDMGVCLLGPKLRLLEANAAARAILETDDAFAVANGRLTNGRRAGPDVVKLLHQLSTGSQNSNHKLTLNLGRASQCVISVFPVPDSDEHPWLDERKVRYLMFFNMRLTLPDTCQSILRAEYGLTRREAQLSSLIASGLTLAAGAQRLKISHETARSHLKHAFDKLAVHSQVELALLIARLNAVR